MRKILLNSNTEVIVDSDMYEYLNHWKWGLNSSGYARRTIRAKNNKCGQATLLMHRFILNLTDPKINIDHINGNRLDNRKENLRIVSQSNNVQKSIINTQCYFIDNKSKDMYIVFNKNNIRFSFGRVKNIKEAEYIHDLFFSIFGDDFSFFKIKKHDPQFSLNFLIELTCKRLKNRCNNTRIVNCINKQLKFLIDYKFNLDKTKKV